MTTAFNLKEILNDEEGILESCDVCNALIFNFTTLTNSFLLQDGRIVCKLCKENINNTNET